MKIPAARIYFSPEDRAWCLEQIDQALGSGQLTLGQFGKQFEEAFARRHGVAHAIAVNSGTSAIEIPLRILGVEGKEVVVPANTFFATAAAVVHAGGRPRLADVDAATFALSLDTLEAAITEQTAGVIIVHIGGLISPEIDAIRQLCDDRGLFLFEDAAHAQGSSLGGRMAGSFGHAAAFSFYPTKVITSGEGGMIVTDDAKLDEQARVFRDQGKAGFFGNFHVSMGYNWRMSEIHAILGISQLRRLDEFMAARNAAARIYDEGLQKTDGVAPVLLPENAVCNYYKYLALLDAGIDRAALKKHLKETYEVGLSGEVYETPIHHQPVFEPYVDGTYPVAEDICSRHICPPVYGNMTGEEAAYTVEAIGKALEEVA